MTTVKELFDEMPSSFDRDAAAEIKAVIQFDITGEGGGLFCVTIDRGELSIVEGAHDEPDLTISAAAQDYIDIGTGELNEQLAFMTGRITARGDTRLAMKMPSIFKR